MFSLSVFLLLFFFMSNKCIAPVMLQSLPIILVCCMCSLMFAMHQNFYSPLKTLSFLSFFPLLPTWWINLYNKLFNPLVPNLKHLCIGVWKWVSLIGLQNICKSSMFSSSSIVCVGLPCCWLQIWQNYILFLKYNIKSYIWLDI